jgi:hypothetical protein
VSGDKEAREGEDLYVLRANFMRYVRTIGYKDNGQPILEPKRYEQGDTISLPESEAERYLRSGAMVREGEFDAEKQAEEDAARRAESDRLLATLAVNPTTAGQTSGKIVGLEDAPEKGGSSEPHEVDGIVVEDIEDVKQPEDATPPDEVASGETAPDIDNLDYPSLVQAAKSAGLSGGGTKDELRERLHEHYGQ